MEKRDRWAEQYRRTPNEMVPGHLVKSSDIAPGDLSKNPCGERNRLAATLRDEAVFFGYIQNHDHIRAQ